MSLLIIIPLLFQQRPSSRTGPVPPLKLSMLKRPGSSSDYHVTRGADTSRSVMSWGDNSYRAAPPGVSKIDTKYAGTKEPDKREEYRAPAPAQQEQQRNTNRVGRNYIGLYIGVFFGSQYYQV